METAIFNTLSNILASLLGLTTIKTSLILLLCFLFTRCIPRLSSATRYSLWVCSFIGVLLLPIVSQLTPSLPLVKLPAKATIAQPEMPANPKFLNNLQGPEPKIPPATTSLVYVNQNMEETVSLSWPSVLVLAWAVGIVFFSLIWFVQQIKVGALIRLSHKPSTRDSVVQRVTQISNRIGIKKNISIHIASSEIIPFTCGIFNPIIVLPQSYKEWSNEKLELILHHEIVHILRRDCLTQLTSKITLMLHWFNPLVWLAEKQLSNERELACDDQVILHGVKPSFYSESLLEIAHQMRHCWAHNFVGIAVTRPTTFERRLLSILDNKLNRKPINRKIYLLTSTTTIAIISFLGAIQITVQEKENKTATPENDATITPIEAKVTSATIANKLERIKIPIADFRGIPVSEAIQKIQKASITYDTTPENQPKGVSIKLRGNHDPKVNITLRGLSLKRLLDFLCQAIGYRYKIENNEVIIIEGSDRENNLRHYEKSKRKFENEAIGKAKLNSIVIPGVEFQNESLDKVIRFIAKQTKRIEQNGGMYATNSIPNSDEIIVSLKLKPDYLLNAIEEMCTKLKITKSITRQSVAFSKIEYTKEQLKEQEAKGRKKLASVKVPALNFKDSSLLEIEKYLEPFFKKITYDDGMQFHIPLIKYDRRVDLILEEGSLLDCIEALHKLQDHTCTIRRHKVTLLVK